MVELCKNWNFILLSLILIFGPWKSPAGWSFIYSLHVICLLYNDILRQICRMLDLIISLRNNCSSAYVCTICTKLRVVNLLFSCHLYIMIVRCLSYDWLRVRRSKQFYLDFRKRTLAGWLIMRLILLLKDHRLVWIWFHRTEIRHVDNVISNDND